MTGLTQQNEPEQPKQTSAKDTSGLKFYSLALVVKTPETFPSEIIEVTPIESLSIQDSGPVDKEEVTYSQTHPDVSGAHDSQKDIQKGNKIEAHWLPLSDSNRQTAPCVYKDEHVVLFKFGDAQKYYWATIKNQKNLRKKEMVRWGVSNEMQPLKEHTKETSYYIEFNSLQKKLEVGTPSSGEGVAYRLCMDVAAAKLDVSDTAGNSLVFNSTSGVVDINGAKVVNVSAASEFNVNAATTNINSSQINLNGDTFVKKSLKLGGGMAVGGGGGGKAATINGDLYCTGNFMAKSINSNSITEAGFVSSDVSVSASGNNAAAAQTASPAAASQGIPTNSNTSSVSVHPSPQTDKSVKVDHAASANKAPDKLTGDKIADAPIIAAKGAGVTHKTDDSALAPVKESIAKLGTTGSQLVNTGAQGLKSITDAAKSVQSSVSSTINKVSSTAQTVQKTVMDPVNSVTRQVRDVSTSITPGIQGFAGSTRSSLSDLIDPIDSVTRDLTGGRVSIASRIDSGIDKFTNFSSKITDIERRITDPVQRVSSSMDSTVQIAQRTISQASDISDRASSLIDRTTNTVDQAREEIKRQSEQLASLADKSASTKDSVFAIVSHLRRK